MLIQMLHQLHLQIYVRTASVEEVYGRRFWHEKREETLWL